MLFHPYKWSYNPIPNGREPTLHVYCVYLPHTSANCDSAALCTKSRTQTFHMALAAWQKASNSRFCVEKVYLHIYIQKNIRMCESWKLIRNLFYLGKFSPPNYLGHDEEIRVCVSASLKSVERAVDPPKSVPYLRSGPAVLFVIKLSALSHFYYPKFPSNSINELICSSFRKKKWSCRLLMNVHHDQQSPVKFWGWGVTSATWMSPEVSKWLGNGL